MRKRGQLDGITDLEKFADRLERATVSTIEDGKMTGDLAAIYKGERRVEKLDTVEFLKEIAKRI